MSGDTVTYSLEPSVLRHRATTTMQPNDPGTSDPDLGIYNWQSYVALSLAFSVIEGLAVFLTLFRLGFRLKIQRFWWEDAWAAVASLCTVISIVSTLVFFMTYNYEPALITGWINAYMFTSVVWSVRMSLVVSLVRITSSILLHHITLAVAACFIFIWITTLGLQTWWYVDNTKTLSGEPRPECILPRFVVIFEVITNCVSDATTLMLSLKLLWRVRLPRRQRRMIISVFSASSFLCAFSLAHSIAQLVGIQGIEELLANLQLVVFLVVCNLLVVVTYIYRVFQGSPNGDVVGDDDFTTPPLGSTQNLTTVDLDLARTSVTRTTSELGSSFFPSPTPSTD